MGLGFDIALLGPEMCLEFGIFWHDMTYMTYMKDRNQ